MAPYMSPSNKTQMIDVIYSCQLILVTMGPVLKKLLGQIHFQKAYRDDFIRSLHSLDKVTRTQLTVRFLF